MSDRVHVPDQRGLIEQERVAIESYKKKKASCLCFKLTAFGLTLKTHTAATGGRSLCARVKAEALPRVFIISCRQRIGLRRQLAVRQHLLVRPIIISYAAEPVR